MSAQTTPQTTPLQSAREEARYQESRWLELENLLDEVRGTEREAGITFKRDVQYRRFQEAHEDFLAAKHAA